MLSFKKAMVHGCVLAACAWACVGPAGAQTTASVAATPSAAAGLAMNRIVQTQVYPQLDHLFNLLSAQKLQLVMDGTPAFNGNDKFLPGKIAIGLGDLLLATPRSDPKFAAYLQGYRNMADLTVGMDNHTWGIYYYLSVLRSLQQAGLLEQAIAPATLARLRQQLDWRTFVTVPDYKLIKLPTNYYGVAFSVARLRYLLGWEDDSGAKQLLDKMLWHYKTYSGQFGFSDETDGEGRFDRYSILLIAEICERFIETGLPVTPELRALLRNAAKLALNIANPAGEGFSFGRSIGAYGDTAPLQILSVAAYLGELTPAEKQHAYAYSTRVVARYVDFWQNSQMQSVDLWGQGRRTDAYRGKHRILGENFSLLHQLVAANRLWNQAGLENQAPADDLAAWLDATQPRFSLTWFAHGDYDRALAIYRDKGHVFSLLMVNGGAGQYANSPYYALPYANNLVAGVADSGGAHPQLLPRLTLADGSQLLPASYFKAIQNTQADSRQEVSWRQDELARLGGPAPVKDARVQVQTHYSFGDGSITRSDTFSAAQPLAPAQLSLEFAAFSDGASVTDGQHIRFQQGAVYAFDVEGAANCTVRSTKGEDAFKSPTGPMATHVQCALERVTLDKPLTVRWTLRYR
jgi:hypothetical protein